MKKIVGIVVVVIAMCGAAHAQTGVESKRGTLSKEGEIAKRPGELAQRGKKLRLAIDQAYQKLATAKAIKNDGTSISRTVESFIPKGTPLEDAQTILRAAGFAIQPRAPNSPEPQKQEVRARIDQLVPPAFGRIGVTVLLRPEGAVVQSLSAEITRSFQ